jgi:hypothetical protein
MEKEYSLSTRKNIKEIDISNKNLEGVLDLKDFVNLEILYCSYNSLTGLDSLEHTKLKKLYCNDNRIRKLNLNFLTLLEDVDCSNNYLDYADLNRSNQVISRKALKLLGTDAADLPKTKTLLSGQTVKQIIQKNQELQKENELLTQLLAMIQDPQPEKINFKHNNSRHEIKIVQSEPDEQQEKLELAFIDELSDKKAEKDTSTKKAIQTEQERRIKQSRRNAQIIVRPKCPPG